MSEKQIEKVKKLKAVYLEYDDGSVIAVPENKALTVGTTFIKAVGQEQLEWQVVKTGKPSLVGRIKKFIEL